LPLVTYGFNKVNYGRRAAYGTQTALESNVFATEAEATEKSKELNRKNV
jgi:hypothetical protein